MGSIIVATNREKDIKDKWSVDINEKGIRSFSVRNKCPIYFPSYLDLKDDKYTDFIINEKLKEFDISISAMFCWTDVKDCNYWAGSEEAESFIHLPLIYKDEVIGLLSLENIKDYNQPCAIEVHDKLIYLNWAYQVATIIMNSEKEETEVQLLNSSFDGFVKVLYKYSNSSFQGIIKDVNTVTEGMLKRKSNELLNQNGFAIENIFSTKGEKNEVEQIQKDLMVSDDGKVEQVKSALIDKNGNEIPVLLSAVLIKNHSDKNVPIGFWCYFKDQRKEMLVEKVARAKTKKAFNGIFVEAAKTLRSITSSEFCSIFEFNENFNFKKPWMFKPRGYDAEPSEIAKLAKNEIYENGASGITAFCIQEEVIILKNNLKHRKEQNGLIVEVDILDSKTFDVDIGDKPLLVEEGYYNDLIGQPNTNNKHVLFIPIISKEGNPFGVIRLLNKYDLSYRESDTIKIPSKNGFEKVDIDIAVFFASQLALLFEKERLSKWTKPLISVYRGRDPKEIANTIVKIVASEMGFRACHLRVLDENVAGVSNLKMLAYSCVCEETDQCNYKAKLQRLNVEETPLNKSFQVVNNCNSILRKNEKESVVDDKIIGECMPIVDSKTRQESQLSNKIIDLFYDMKLDAGIILPLYSRTKCFGTLSLYTSLPRLKFSLAEKSALLYFGKLAGDAYHSMETFDFLIMQIHKLSTLQLEGIKLNELIETGRLNDIANEIARFMDNSSCTIYLRKDMSTIERPSNFEYANIDEIDYFLMLIGWSEKMKPNVKYLNRTKEPYIYDDKVDYKIFNYNKYKRKKIEWKDSLNKELFEKFYSLDKKKEDLNFIIEEGITAWIARLGMYFFANDEFEIEKHDSRRGRIPYKKYLAVPLLYTNNENTDSKILGVIKVEKQEEGEDSFTELDRRFLEIIAAILTNTLAIADLGAIESVTYDKIIGMKIIELILGKE